MHEGRALNCPAMPTKDDDRLQYLQLQQESDFALWKAQEAINEMKAAYALLANGKGPGPSGEELDALARLQEDAAVKYRALRDFVRAWFA